jgi:hypothetical protein
MKKNTIRNANIILEQRYLKQKLVIVESDSSPNNDSEYLNLIKDNGFTLKPYTTNMVWKYENDKTKVYTYKLKSGDIYLGQTQFFNPKTNLQIPSSVIRFKLPFVSESNSSWDELMSKYIQSKNTFDPSWSLESINNQIEKIEGNLSDMKETDINKFGDVFIRTIKGVEDNINKWLEDPDKSTAVNSLNTVKTLAKEKGLNFG